MNGLLDLVIDQPWVLGVGVLLVIVLWWPHSEGGTLAGKLLGLLLILEDPESRIRRIYAMTKEPEYDPMGYGCPQDDPGMWRDAYKKLEWYLLNDPIPSVRAAAARAIGQCRLAQGVPVLLKLLEKTRSQDFQQALIDGLAGVRGAAAIDGLIRFLKTNPPVPIRLHLVQAFQRLDNRSVLPALRELEATEKDPSVRAALTEAIRSIQAPAPPRPI